jgi:hypothetical protein
MTNLIVPGVPGYPHIHGDKIWSEALKVSAGSGQSLTTFHVTSLHK